MGVPRKDSGIVLGIRIVCGFYLICSAAAKMGMNGLLSILGGILRIETWKLRQMNREWKPTTRKVEMVWGTPATMPRICARMPQVERLFYRVGDAAELNTRSITAWPPW